MKTFHRLLLCLFLLSITTVSFALSNAKITDEKSIKELLLINTLKTNWKTVLSPPTLPSYPCYDIAYNYSGGNVSATLDAWTNSVTHSPASGNITFYINGQAYIQGYSPNPYTLSNYPFYFVNGVGSEDISPNTITSLSITSVSPTSIGTAPVYYQQGNP